MIETVEKLLARMSDLGAERFYLKKLSPNDNSKNQLYLGGSFSVLNLIPHGSIVNDDSNTAGSKKERAKAKLDFYWADENHCEVAPATQLILYPKYPEVRMSGFLAGSRHAPSDVMATRDEGRLLFLGICHDGKILGYACKPNTHIANEIHTKNLQPTNGVLTELFRSGIDDSKVKLLEALTAVYNKHWIPSQKLGKDGIALPYSARNGGGYTLEAELGIKPNGYAEPDYLGWEIKQFGVRDFNKFAPKSPVTLFTPEPTGGIYKEAGIIEFMRRYSYADKSGKEHRVNFGGVYKAGGTGNKNTGLRMTLRGFDSMSKKITDFVDGGLLLLSETDEVAAKWGFSGLLEHWDRKHAKAAYVPSLFRTPPPEYSYGPKILLCEGTEFTNFLMGVYQGKIFYDPAIKIEGTPIETGALKKRSQFRINHANLHELYTHTKEVKIQ